MQTKPKIAFVVTSPLFVRNYFRTDALTALESACDVTFLVSDSLPDIAPITTPGRRVVIYQSDAANKKRQFDTYKVLMWRFRNRSSTFRFRIDRTHQPKHAYRPASLANLGHNLRAWGERVGIAYRRARLALLAWGPVYAAIRRRRIDGLVPAAGIARALDEAAPDLIVAPSSAFDPEGNDVIRHGETKGIRTLFLIDNWDNLSSKSVMLLRPDHLGVWGEQSGEHARRIQDFPAERITILGTPRFDEYFRARTEDLPSPFPFPYILFLGTSLAFDEATALEHLDGVLDRDRDSFADVKIVYRPHPWRESRDSIAGRELRHVVLDPQLADRHLKGERGVDFQPDLSYYPSLLKNAEIVVGGLTSMLIEATIFWKDFVALTYDDGVHVTNQRTVLERSEHFRGIERIPSLALCREKSDAERLIRAAWAMRGRRDRDAIDAARRFILHDDPRPYRDRLLALVQAELARAGELPSQRG